MSSKNFKETKVFKLAFQQAMNVFEKSKTFPKEETYSLIDQIRRSSRSVCTNLAEAYRKKRYPANFISKLTECDAENSETNIWLDFAVYCRYISIGEYNIMLMHNEEIGKLLNHMINNPEKY